MPTTPKILVFGGSLRRDSYNHKLAALAAKAAESAGATVTFVRLSDFPMPLFDQDIEDKDGLPEHAKRLKKLFVGHDGFLIASPEYNSGMTAALKNAMDWVSRQESDDEPALVAYRGKAAALLSASPGALGGLRNLVHLRSILGNIGVHVLPDQVCVAKAHEAFADDGSLKDAKQAASVKKIAESLTAFLKKHAA